MAWTPGYALGLAVRVARRTLDRARTDGWYSGWTCLKAHLVNFATRAPGLIPAYRITECPCCGWTGYQFRAIDCGDFIVRNSWCPTCGGYERHRMFHLYFTRQAKGFLAEGGRVLHFAPEPHVRKLLADRPEFRSFGTDLDPGQLKELKGESALADIHHLPFQDGSFDGIFCFHVLEHVADDRRALAEIYRITRPGHHAAIMVPFMMDHETTWEYDEPNPHLWDHMRGYSPNDFKDRLAPFQYEEVFPSTFLTPAEIKRFAVPADQILYYCHKEG
jgi:SAM-dependent methyltransferase